MHFSTIALAAAAVGSVVAADSPSICDKYTTALLKNNTGANQYTLLTLLVNTAVIGNYTGKGTKNPTLPGSMVNVPGIVASNATYMGMPVNLAKYFDGSLLSTNANGMAASVNFLDGGAPMSIIANATSAGTEGSKQATLLNHLYQYFGAALGCSMYGKEGFPAYAGVTSQFNVHRYMDLSATEFDYFVSQVGASALSFGASMADVTTAANLLNTTFGMKCAPAAKVLPDAQMELQAICVGSGCPTASAAACSAYPMETPAVAASSASMSGSMMSSSMMSSGMMTGSMMTGSMMTGSMTGSMTVATPTTGGAALATAMPVAAAGIAGLVALAL